MTYRRRDTDLKFVDRLIDVRLKRLGARPESKATFASHYGTGGGGSGPTTPAGGSGAVTVEAWSQGATATAEVAVSKLLGFGAAHIRNNPAADEAAVFVNSLSCPMFVSGL